ncbi:MAG: hypothetical protein K2P64_02010 [Lachnospiraceae bacterium]|nr:hypothetical protein [Lachnospiraceae bacterium]
MLAAMVLKVEANFALAELALDICCWYCSIKSPEASAVDRNFLKLSSTPPTSSANFNSRSVFQIVSFGCCEYNSKNAFISLLISGTFFLK